MEVPLAVRPLFVAAGWQPGRCVGVDSRVPQRHPAFEVLQEFGGLHVVRSEGGGIECGRADLEFCFREGDLDILSTWSELLRSRLVEVAEVQNRHGWLFVDEAGRCFGARRLLLGYRSRPMLRPDQHQVVLYGETFARGHSAIFEFYP